MLDRRIQAWSSLEKARTMRRSCWSCMTESGLTVMLTSLGRVHDLCMQLNIFQKGFVISGNNRFVFDHRAGWVRSKVVVTPPVLGGSDWP
jgi:hypothetical protein